MPGLQRYAKRSGALILAVVTGVCALSASRVPAAREAAGGVFGLTQDAEAPAHANPLWGIPLGELVATRERPIFSPSRRPPAPAVLAAAEPTKFVPPPPEPSRPPLVLVGTIIGESRQIGIFLEETTKEMVRLATGEGHGGWVLRSVDTRGVQFARGERAATLVLRPPDDQRPTPALAAAPPDQRPASGSAAAPVAELIPPVRHRKR